MNIIQNALQIDGIKDIEALFLVWLKLEGGTVSKSLEEFDQIFGGNSKKLPLLLQVLAADQLIYYYIGDKIVVELTEFAYDALSVDYNISN
jgi:hypothetical protein